VSDFRPVGVDHVLDELEEMVASTSPQMAASSGAAGPASAHPLTLDERESIPKENASTSLHTVAGASATESPAGLEENMAAETRSQARFDEGVERASGGARREWEKWLFDSDKV